MSAITSITYDVAAQLTTLTVTDGTTQLLTLDYAVGQISSAALPQFDIALADFDLLMGQIRDWLSYIRQTFNPPIVKPGPYNFTIVRTVDICEITGEMPAGTDLHLYHKKTGAVTVYAEDAFSTAVADYAYRVSYMSVFVLESSILDGA